MTWYAIENRAASGGEESALVHLLRTAIFLQAGDDEHPLMSLASKAACGARRRFQVTVWCAGDFEELRRALEVPAGMAVEFCGACAAAMMPTEYPAEVEPSSR